MGGGERGTGTGSAKTAEARVYSIWERENWDGIFEIGKKKKRGKRN